VYNAKFYLGLICFHARRLLSINHFRAPSMLHDYSHLRDFPKPVLQFGERLFAGLFNTKRKLQEIAEPRENELLRLILSTSNYLRLGAPGTSSATKSTCATIDSVKPGFRRLHPALETYVATVQTERRKPWKTTMTMMSVKSSRSHDKMARLRPWKTRSALAKLEAWQNRTVNECFRKRHYYASKSSAASLKAEPWREFLTMTGPHQLANHKIHRMQ